jgi:sec-independent protein translocase protein TatB
MFGVDTIELLIVAVAALIFIGPKELPGAMRAVGRFVGRMRGMARHFTAGIETMMREAELEEMEKQWRAENERIMGQYPDAIDADGEPMRPLPMPDAADGYPPPEVPSPGQERELP